MWGASEKVMPSRLVLEGTRLPSSGSRVCLPACSCLLPFPCLTGTAEPLWLPLALPLTPSQTG